MFITLFFTLVFQLSTLEKPTKLTKQTSKLCKLNLYSKTYEKISKVNMNHMPNCTQTNKPSERQIFLLPILSIMLRNIIATKKKKHSLQTHICSNQQQNLHLICDLQPHWHRPAQDFSNKNRSRLPLFFVVR